MRTILTPVFLILVFAGCNQSPIVMKEKKLNHTEIQVVKNALIDKFGKEHEELIEQGVKHTAALWRESDGTFNEFNQFCLNHFIADQEQKARNFEKISRNLEILLGHFNTIALELQRPIHESLGDVTPIDESFSSYSPDAHLQEDLFRSKLAFSIALNYPYYSLKEKEEKGRSWSRQEWAYARLGDWFMERIPAGVKQDFAEVTAQSDLYISQYNIFAGNLIHESGRRLFPKDMVLLAHWNLRDELKSNYSQGDSGVIKQQMIYQVMQRIIDQTIPSNVINQPDMEWDPVNNRLFQNGKTLEVISTQNERYQHILNNFKALKAFDSHSPMKSFVERAFEGTMEMTQKDVEQLFQTFLKSEEVSMVATLIQSRLGRKLQPWDIWYDGFKDRSSLNENHLNTITQKRFPNAAAFKSQLPEILSTLGFSQEKAMFLSQHIEVDAARGSGHAWGAQMRGLPAHLRTRIPESGMNYKGYNIAMHELGHNVEQTISLNLTDHYLLNGVPNTAFTEALAFIFQKRDLILLGIKNENSRKEALAVLDNFWSTYEIMGVSLLDQYTWQWMYEHPDASAEELKQTVIRLSKEVWNNYYAPVFGITDQPILAVYSHMITNPLYLSNYAVGNLIEFQIEQHLLTADFAQEVERMYKIGRLTPNNWMLQAVGQEISVQPILQGTRAAVQTLQ